MEPESFSECTSKGRRPLVDGLVWLLWASCYFLVSVIGRVYWATVYLFGVVLITSAFALLVSFVVRLVCHCP